MPRKPDSRPPKSQRSRSRTDQELLEGIRRGREQDFNLLYERYFRRVYGFAQGRLRNRADAEEVVQETFTAVFRSVDAYRGRSSLLSWIYGIAKNTVNNHVRRAKAHELRIERAELELQRAARSVDSYTPEEHLNLQRCAATLAQRLGSVADWHAEVFVLRHVENLSISEIARRMSRSNDAIRSSLYRVKRLLVETIDRGLAPAG